MIMVIVLKSEIYLVSVNCYLSNIYISYLFITVNSLKHKQDSLYQHTGIKICSLHIYHTSVV